MRVPVAWNGLYCQYFQNVFSVMYDTCPESRNAYRQIYNVNLF